MHGGHDFVAAMARVDASQPRRAVDDAPPIGRRIVHPLRARQQTWRAFESAVPRQGHPERGHIRQCDCRRAHSWRVSSPAFYEQEVVKAFCELTHESSARSFGRLSWGSAVARVKGRRSVSAAALDAAKGQYAGVWCGREPSRPHHIGAFCAAAPANFHRRPQCCNPGLCPGHLKPNRRARET
jgi:hypothetical protein